MKPRFFGLDCTLTMLCSRPRRRTAPRRPGGSAPCASSCTLNGTSVGDERVALSETTGARRTWFGCKLIAGLLCRDACVREDERHRALRDQHRAGRHERRDLELFCTVTSTFSRRPPKTSTTVSSSERMIKQRPPGPVETARLSSSSTGRRNWSRRKDRVFCSRRGPDHATRPVRRPRRSTFTSSCACPARKRCLLLVQ